VRPSRSDAEADAGKRQHSGAQDCGVTASGQAEAVVAVVAWAAAPSAGEAAPEEAESGAAALGAAALGAAAEGATSVVPAAGATRSSRQSCSSKSAEAGYTYRPRIAPA